MRYRLRYPGRFGQTRGNFEKKKKINNSCSGKFYQHNTNLFTRDSITGVFLETFHIFFQVLIPEYT